MSAIRSDWLAQTDSAVERLTDDLSTIDVRGSVHLLQQFIDSLEPPPDALHGAVLSTILMDACGRIVHALHEQNPPAKCGCDATIWSHVSRVAQWRDADPRIAFRDWLDTFFAGVDKDHPADIAVRAAQLIRREPARSWTVDALAAAVAARPVVLRREFLARFGMRPNGYMHLVRVTRAIGLLRSSAKVETVAWEVGYRSKKDLYAALGRWAGSTPTELRALSDDECHWLERELRVQGLRGLSGPAPTVRPVGGKRAIDGGRGSSDTPVSRR